MSRNNLTLKVKGLYSEKYKTLMKEIKDDTNKWKDTSCSCINIVKMFILPREIQRVNVISIKIPIVFFTEVEQIILKFV